MHTNAGYMIRKDTFDRTTFYQHTKRLMFSPSTTYDELVNPWKKNDKFPAYMHDSTHMWVPKYYAVKYMESSFPHDGVPLIGAGTRYAFAGSLRDKQTEVYDMTIKHLGKRGGGILGIYTGFGKTVLALKVISTLCRKTLIVVHKTALLDQWVQRIQEFIPEARIGKIQGKIFDVEDKDIVIGMLQTLSMATYSVTDLKDIFTFVVVDECHHIGSKMFSKSLLKVSCPYSLGLSATPRRKDGCWDLIEYNLGPVIVHIKQVAIPPKILVKKCPFNIEIIYNKDNVNKNRAAMVSNLTIHDERNEWLLKICTDVITEEPQRKILFLTERREHCETFKDMCNKQGIPAYVVYGGTTDLKFQYAEENAQVLCSTYQWFSEGIDSKVFNSLIFASPMSDIEQAMGRILRKKELAEGDLYPLIIDIIDSVFYFSHRQRLKIYAKMKCTLTGDVKKAKETTKKCLFDIPD